MQVQEAYEAGASGVTFAQDSKFLVSGSPATQAKQSTQEEI